MGPRWSLIADDDEMLQRVDHAHRFDPFEIVDRAPPIGDDQRFRLRLTQNEADLRGAIDVDDRHHDDADLKGRLVSQRTLDPVGHLYGEGVSGPQPQGPEAAGDRGPREMAATSPSGGTESGLEGLSCRFALGPRDLGLELLDLILND